MARLQEQDQQHLIAIQLDAMRDQITNLQSRMDWLWGMMGVAGLGIAAISALSCYLYFRKEEKRERLIPQIGAVKWNEYCWHLTQICGPTRNKCLQNDYLCDYLNFSSYLAELNSNKGQFISLNLSQEAMRLSVKNKHKETMRAKITYACKRYDWASGVLSDPLPLKRLPNRADEVYKKQIWVGENEEVIISCDEWEV